MDWQFGHTTARIPASKIGTLLLSICDAFLRVQPLPVAVTLCYPSQTTVCVAFLGAGIRSNGLRYLRWGGQRNAARCEKG